MIGSNIRTSMRAARRRPHPKGAHPPDGLRVLGAGGPIGSATNFEASTPDSVTPTPIAEPAEGTLCRPQIEHRGCTFGYTYRGTRCGEISTDAASAWSATATACAQSPVGRLSQGTSCPSDALPGDAREESRSGALGPACPEDTPARRDPIWRHWRRRHRCSAGNRAAQNRVHRTGARRHRAG